MELKNYKILFVIYKDDISFSSEEIISGKNEDEAIHWLNNKWLSDTSITLKIKRIEQV